MEDKELLEELSPQKIINVRRITKKTPAGIIGTSTLILTINSTIIPEFIHFGLLRIRTRIYYSQPLLCRQCLQYGHPKSRCKNMLACKNCSQSHESADCQIEPFCGNCKITGHSPLDRKCPIWTAESTALKLSTDENIPINEAPRMVHTSSNTLSYANAVKANQKQQITTHQQKVQKKEAPNQQTSLNQKRTLEKPHTPTAPQQSFQTEVISLDSDSPPRKRTPLPTSLPTTSAKEVVREEIKGLKQLSNHIQTDRTDFLEPERQFPFDFNGILVPKRQCGTEMSVREFPSLSAPWKKWYQTLLDQL
ncbi:uncharacterized protein LOC129740414 [Uranotaenia lowii]|uniref:uncharacterized protein LOC129740414 n=1 Tax=Uranotaenia lowii TaxID=190385 RepID=UPI00247A2EF2|nr:uncharacterized protein LOC129740414 [Uranotaenia lowii]XP_055588050.1 uncharacterized protein LOC129740414 [Uranotaenia lowii]